MWIVLHKPEKGNGVHGVMVLLFVRGHGLLARAEMGVSCRESQVASSQQYALIVHLIDRLRLAGVVKARLFCE